MTISQKQRVINHILEKGGVSNFWAIENYILRLGAIIYDLKRDGWEFEGTYGKELKLQKKNWKNYYYLVKVNPLTKVIGNIYENS